MADALTAGSTRTFFLDAVLDNGSPWDLSAATVTLLLRKPDNVTLVEYPATITDAAGGVAEATVLFDTAGNWLRSWKVEDGAVVQYTRARVETVGPGILTARPRLGTIACA